MADQIAINVKVIDSEVGPKLRQVRDQIKGAFADAERSAKGLGQANAGVVKSLEAVKVSWLGAFSGRARAGAELGEGGEGARKLLEGLHGLSPVLDGVGLGLANMRGFAAAARFGIAGLAAVTAGAVLVGLEKFSDHVEDAKKKVTDLGGSGEDFETLRKSAVHLGVDVGDLAATYESLAKARSKSGGATIIYNNRGPNGEVVPGTSRFPGAASPASADTLQKLFELGAGNIEGGQKDLQAFRESIEKSGRVAPDVAERLSQGSARQIQKLFGLPETVSGSAQEQLKRQLGSGRSIPELEARLRQAAPRINQESAAAPIGLGDAFSRLKSSVEGTLPGFTGLASAVNALANFINQRTDHPTATSSRQPETIGRRQQGGDEGAKPADLSDLFTRIKNAGEGLIASFLAGAAVGRGAGNAEGHWRGGTIGLSGFAGGGTISGPGSGTSDSILAFVNGGGVIRVSNGEGIVNARAMRRIGSGGLDAINGYADGGVPGPFVAAQGASASPGKTVTVNLTLGGNTYPAAMHESVAEQFVQDSINYRIASGGRRQSSIS